MRIVLAVLASLLLAGCVIEPGSGWHHHHGYYHDYDYHHGY